MKHAIIFVMLMILSWLTFTVLWAFMDSASYMETLRQPAQVAGFVFLYWWMPGVFYLNDQELLGSD